MGALLRAIEGLTVAVNANTAMLASHLEGGGAGMGGPQGIAEAIIEALQALGDDDEDEEEDDPPPRRRRRR